jgi:hypothetical protein
MGKCNVGFSEKSFSGILKTGHGKGKSGPTTTVGKQRYSSQCGVRAIFSDGSLPFLYVNPCDGPPLFSGTTAPKNGIFTCISHAFGIHTAHFLVTSLKIQF